MYVYIHILCIYNYKYIYIHTPLFDGSHAFRKTPRPEALAAVAVAMGASGPRCHSVPQWLGTTCFNQPGDM